MSTNLIFDLDNTLLDFSASEANGLSTVFGEFGVPDTAATRATYNHVNQGLWAQLERGELTRTQLLANRFNHFFAAIDHPNLSGQDAEALYRHELNNGFDRVPGAKTLLTNLHDSGFRILAGTNGNSDTQRNRLVHSHLAPFFDGIYISEEIGYDKPAAQFYTSIFAHEQNLNRTNTIMIGDGLNSDIRGGANFGLRTVWVNLHAQINQTELTPTREVHTLPELNQLLHGIV